MKFIFVYDLLSRSVLVFFCFVFCLVGNLELGRGEESQRCGLDDELDPGSHLFFLSIAAVGKSLHMVTCCQSRRSIRIFELNERILNFNHDWLKYLELSRTESFPIELNC